MARLRIAVIGVGKLGQAVAFRVLQEPYVKEMLLVDIREDFGAVLPKNSAITSQ